MLFRQNFPISCATTFLSVVLLWACSKETTINQNPNPDTNQGGAAGNSAAGTAGQEGGSAGKGDGGGAGGTAGSAQGGTGQGGLSGKGGEGTGGDAGSAGGASGVGGGAGAPTAGAGGEGGSGTAALVPCAKGLKPSLSPPVVVLDDPVQRTALAVARGASGSLVAWVGTPVDKTIVQYAHVDDDGKVVGAIHDLPFDQLNGEIAAVYSSQTQRFLIAATTTGPNSGVQGIWIDEASMEPDADGQKTIYPASFPSHQPLLLGWSNGTYVLFAYISIGTQCNTGGTKIIFIDEGKESFVVGQLCNQAAHSLSVQGDYAPYAYGNGPGMLKLSAKDGVDAGAGYVVAPSTGATTIVGNDGQHSIFAWSEAKGFVYHQITPTMLSINSGTDTSGGGKTPLAIVHGKEDTAVLLSSGKSLYLLARSGVQESMATGLVLGDSREGTASLHWDGAHYTIFDLRDKGSFQQVRRTKVMCKP